MHITLAESEPFDISPSIDPAWGWLAVAVFTGVLAWLAIREARYLPFESAWPRWLGGVALAMVSTYGLVSFIGSLLAGVTLGMLLLAGLIAWWITNEG